MAVWKEETEEHLVCMVQERPALYNITENVYANKVLKTHLWKEISDKLRVSGELPKLSLTRVVVVSLLAQTEDVDDVLPAVWLAVD